MADEQPITLDEVKAAASGLSILAYVTQSNLPTRLEPAESRRHRWLVSPLERQSLLTPFQIQKLLKGDTNGYFIGRFKIQYKIAAGAFARCVSRRRYANGRGGGGQGAARSPFARQRYGAEFLSRSVVDQNLSHPNITRTIEVDVDAQTNQHYIAMGVHRRGQFSRVLAHPRQDRTARDGPAGQRNGRRAALCAGARITTATFGLRNVLVSATGRVKMGGFRAGRGFPRSRQQRPHSSGLPPNSERTITPRIEKATNAPKAIPAATSSFLGRSITRC